MLAFIRVLDQQLSSINQVYRPIVHPTISYHASQREIHRPQAPRRSQRRNPQRRQRWCSRPMVCEKSPDDGRRVCSFVGSLPYDIPNADNDRSDTKNAEVATTPKSPSKTSRRSIFLSGLKRSGRLRKARAMRRRRMVPRSGICPRRRGSR